MAVTATGGTGTSSAATGLLTDRTAKELDKQAFLKLLVAQLRNQDPQSPLQPHELAAQLAQFSSVEQLVSLNSAVNAQAQANQLAALANQTAFGASLLGRVVVAEGNRLTVPASGTASLTLDVAGAGGKAVLKLLDVNGKVTATKDLGGVAFGRQTIEVGGLTSGTFRYAVEVTGPNGETIPVRSLTEGTVTSVTFDGANGAPMLHVGDLEVPIDQLIEIRPAAAGGAAAQAFALTSR